MKATMKLIVSRLQEGSTWAGISALFLANAMIMGSEYQTMLGACALVSGAVAIILKDPNHA